MGRPVNKKHFGLLADAAGGTMPVSAGDTFFNLTINVQVGSNAETASGYILAQKSPTRFLVNDKKTGTNDEPGDTEAGNSQGNVGVCTLVDKAAGSLAANEMSIYGYISGEGVGGEPVRIKKLYNRTCRDFSNNRYTWEIQNDSSVTALILTAI